MKTAVLSLSCWLLSFIAQAQTNTFPASGSVGIGTTSPSTLLHVHNSNNLGTSTGSTIEIARFSGVNVNISQLRIQLNRYASGNDWYSASMRLQHVMDYTNAGYIEFDPINGNAGVAIGSGANEIVRFVSSGNIGIGVVNPGAMLHIKGRSNDAQINLETNNGLSKWQLVSIQSTNNFAIADLVSGTTPFVINKGAPNNSVNVTNNGNVCININPQVNTAYKLDVGGAARANKVVVNSTGADFVFDSSYDLKPLSHVEKYINQNHHLQDIQPAAAMQKEGIDLGDNQTKLLQKIEELTLYLIEQNKKIEAQESKIQEILNAQEKLQLQNKALQQKLDKRAEQ